MQEQGAPLARVIRVGNRPGGSNGVIMGSPGPLPGCQNMALPLCVEVIGVARTSWGELQQHLQPGKLGSTDPVPWAGHRMELLHIHVAV